MQNSKGWNILGIIALILVVGGFGAFYMWDKSEQEKQNTAFQQQDKEDNQKQYARSKAITRYMEDVQKTVQSEMSGFVILGDDYIAARNNLSFQSCLSMTIDNKLFYDLNLEMETTAALDSIELEIPVENHAVIDESFLTILTRIGVKPLYLADDITIPALRDTVEITFKTENDIPVEFSSQVEEKLGRTIIGKVAGAMYFSQKENKYIYNFMRSKEGSSDISVKAGTSVTVESSEFSKDLIPIVFFGNNDYKNTDQYVKTLKKVIDRQSGSKGRFIIIGRAKAGSDLDKAMSSQFGDNYIRVEADEKLDIDNQQLADTVFDKMESLGYFSEIEEKADLTKKQIAEYDKQQEGKN